VVIPGDRDRRAARASHWQKMTSQCVTKVSKEERRDWCTQAGLASGVVRRIPRTIRFSGLGGYSQAGK